MSETDDLTFQDIPPFPENVPTAPLLRLSLQKLLNNDDSEIKRLYEACCDVGFFYLDIRNAASPELLHKTNGQTNGHTNGTTNGHTNGVNTSHGIDGNHFLSDANALFDVADAFHQLPVEEKQKYDFKDQGSYFGYKGYGAGLIDKEGTKDRNEFYNISKDDILGYTDPIPAPKLLEKFRPLFRSYIETSHAIILLLLSHLNSLLHLPPDTLSSLHRLSSASGDIIRFVASTPQPEQDRRTALGAHTDFGSVTLLFNRLGGLQILPPDTDGMSEEQKVDAWQYVRPLKGHCIVNLGDAMVKFTRGVLRSNTHRVVNPPGEQAESLRFSLVYFNRPTDEVLLKPLEGSDVIDKQRPEGDGEEIITSKEWVLRRALGRRGVGEFSKSEGTESSRTFRGMREVDAAGS